MLKLNFKAILLFAFLYIVFQNIFGNLKYNEDWRILTLFFAFSIFAFLLSGIKSNMLFLVASSFLLVILYLSLNKNFLLAIKFATWNFLILQLALVLGFFEYLKDEKK